MPNGFEERTIAPGLSAPTAIAWAPDGRMFIAEKKGRVKVVSASGVLQTTPLLDISSHVYGIADRGLLGIAVDSDFASNHYMYLLYVYQPPSPPDQFGARTSRLTRVTVNDNNTASSETVLLGGVGTPPCPAPSNTVDCIPADGDSHSIGTVRSAPDGTLWAGSGDGADWSKVDPLAVRTYDEQSFAGKIWHIDRNGNGLPGHPFCPDDSNLTHVCTKIYAKGFRNPFRFSLRAGAGPAVGDVGWETTEEIDLLSPGGNYGWPCYEGAGRTSGYKELPECASQYANEGGPFAAKLPVYSWGHPEVYNWQGAAIAGPTYPGGSYPDEFDGDIFFGDYVQGYVKRMEFNAQGQVTGTPIFLTDWHGVDLELGPANELYYVDFGDGSPGTGSIKRVVYTPGNASPIAQADASPAYGPVPLDVDFSGAASSDPDGDQLTYEWDFGDGSPHSLERDPTHTYSSSQNYTASLTVTDGRGGQSTDTVLVSPGNSPPTVSLQGPANGAKFLVGETVQLQGSATDPQQGNLTGSALSWHIALIHNTHVHDLATLSGSSPSFEAAADHDADAHYRIKLTATDARGLTDSETVDIYPETINLVLASSPTGAPMTYAGGTQPAPMSRQAAIGFVGSISAAQSFVVDGTTYEFTGWSDGGARAHEIAIPAVNTTLTATYSVALPAPFTPPAVPGPFTPAAPSVPPVLSDGTAPVLKLLAGKAQNALKQKGIIVEAGSDEASTITASGSLVVPTAGKSRLAKRYKLKPVSKSLGAGQETKLKLKFGAKLMRAIAVALRRGKLKTSIQVTAADRAGNKATRTLKITLKR